MAAERNSDLRAIVIVQTLRVVMLAVGVPGGLALLGLAAPARLPEGAFSAFDAPLQFAVLFGGSVAAALALYAVRFSGGFFFGPMLVSAILHGSGLVQVNFPAVIGNIAMIGLGAINGARFFGTSFRVLLQYVAAALGSFAVALACCRRLRRGCGLYVIVARARSRGVLRARLGRCDDDSRVGAAPRPGVCRRASSRAHTGRCRSRCR